ncbi:MAG: hypothetical protein PHW73_10895 [Atribacterota bacterium]|nr:hypothetical protein [Atribacterota bacterium]
MDKKIKKSTCKIVTKEFNNCPGKKEIQKEMREIVGIGTYTYVDVKDQCWQNDPATLVFLLRLYGQEDERNIQLALNAGVLANRLLADEFDWKMIDQQTFIIRLWWD